MARENGVQVALSTGRTILSCRSVIDQLSLDGYHICFDGALVCNVNLNDIVYTNYNISSNNIMNTGNNPIHLNDLQGVVVSGNVMNSCSGNIWFGIIQTLSVTANASYNSTPGPDAIDGLFRVS